MTDFNTCGTSVDTDDNFDNLRCGLTHLLSGPFLHYAEITYKTISANGNINQNG